MGNEVIELENGFTRNQSRVSKFITEARSNLNLNELKAFYQLTTLINMEDKDFNNYEISIREFVDTLELQNKDRAYIKKICKNLLEQNFILDYTHENNDWDLVKISIFKQFSYKHKEQKLLISFSEDIKPYLLELKERFTKIENVEYIKQFKKKYAIRFYAMLKDYRKMTYRDFDMEALHKILQSPKTYIQDFGKFREKVLDPAVKEINEKSDLYISKIEEIKKERKKVLKIRIHFGNKSEKIANEKIKYLLEYYDKYRGQYYFKLFYGMYYIHPQSPTKTIKDLRKITSIEVDRESMYFRLFCDNQDNATLGISGERFFLRALCMGIHEAVLIYYENDKKNRLDFGDWQVEQDEKKAQKQRIEEYKEVIRVWQGIKKEG